MEANICKIILFQNGDTALHLAVKANNYETTEALLQCCADLTIRNKVSIKNQMLRVF